VGALRFAPAPMSAVTSAVKPVSHRCGPAGRPPRPVAVCQAADPAGAPLRLAQAHRTGLPLDPAQPNRG